MPRAKMFVALRRNHAQKAAGMADIASKMGKLQKPVAPSDEDDVKEKRMEFYGTDVTVNFTHQPD